MQLIRINNAQEDIFKQAMELYSTSFPVYEQRRLSEQKQVMEIADYYFMTLYDDQQFIGLLLYWECSEFIYVEHFCTLPSLRGQGYGIKILAELAKICKIIILEIDPPQDDISKRRRAFYERAAYHSNEFTHLHPPYRVEYHGHRLMVMSWPQPISQALYDKFSGYLNNTIMHYAQKNDRNR